MKKFVSFIIAAAMLSAAVYAEAEGTVTYEVSQGVQPQAPDYYTVSGDIEAYLAENGYPEYVSYLFNTGCVSEGYDPSSGEGYQPTVTYHWEIGLANATAEQKNEIQALLDGLYSGENVITFNECTYSHAEREALIPEIRKKVTDIFPDAEILDVINTNNPFILVEVKGLDDEQMGILQKRLGEAYGELIIVSDGLDKVDDVSGAQPGMGGDIAPAPPIATEPAIGEMAPDNVFGEPASPVGGDVDAAPPAGELAAITAPEQSADSTILWICIAAALVVILGTVAFIYRAKLVPVFATSHGDMTAKKTGKKAVEEAVKNSEVIPDDSVLQAIKEKLDK